MKRYLNRQEKNEVLELAALVSYLEEKFLENKRKPKEYKTWAKYARTYIFKIMDAYMANLDQHEVERLVAGMKSREVTVLYKTEAKREYEKMLKMESTVPVEADDLLDIVEQAINICVECEKTGSEAQNCHLKKLFLKYDIEPLDHHAPPGRCPYKYKEE